ncbi:putative manganese transporter, partial [Vibrio vulnificus]
ATFSGLGVWMPLIGVAVGMLPGCGPQILMTSLYLSGAAPLSAQLANAISNDGDALFPAIAMAPKAALVATIYSAIPAFIVGYGYFFLFEY